MSYFGAIRIGDGANLDSFSRLRVSQPVTLGSSQSTYGQFGLRTETGAKGTGVAPSFSSDTRMRTLSVGAGTGTSFLQSYEYFQYQPGKSQLIFITGVVGAAVANVVKEMGYFDAANGIIFRQNGTSGLAMVRRSSCTGSIAEEVVTQSNWNVDKMDGTGASGITLDITKDVILVIDLQFLAMGRVRIGFDINGQIYYAHQFLNANNLSIPYMQTAALPIQILVTATSSGSSASLDFKCYAVSSESGIDAYSGFPFSTPGTTLTISSGVRTHIMSIRPKTTLNGITNREKIGLQHINILAGANPVFYELVIGATFSVAPTWADVNATYSGVEYATGGTLSGVGLVIESGYLGSSNANAGSVSVQNIADFYPLSLNRAGAQRALGTYSLLLTALGGNSTCYSSMCVLESR